MITMLSDGKTHEEIATLGIASWAQSNGTSGAQQHGVVMFLTHEFGQRLQTQVFSVDCSLFVD
jgi:hypothetical protein